MSGFTLFLTILIGIASGFFFYFVGIYNNLVRLRNQYKNAFSQIDVQLKRRYDLIPNLVETTKTYLSHERGTLEAVIAARNKAQTANLDADPEHMNTLIQAESGLNQALGRLIALTENYPELKANQNMMQLSEELTSTENKIGFARQAYNDSVMSHNTAIESFPDLFIARSFRFFPAKLWESQDSVEREPLKISFN
ncbi:MAG TPA: LemA family protein [Pseudomonadales bacterium]|nr:LemA family protein [Pseudomonadales bacterium]